MTKESEAALEDAANDAAERAKIRDRVARSSISRPNPLRRAVDDFYETPPHAVERFLAVEKFTGPIWEPACGRGAISKTMEQEGYVVHSTDLVDRGYGTTGLNFLKVEKPDFKFRNIVTNPPFNLSDEFAVHALSLATGKVAMLNRLVWLEGKRRRVWLEKTPLSHVWVYCPKIRCPQMATPRSGTFFGTVSDLESTGGVMTYAWFVWDKKHKVGNPPTIWWI